MLLYALIPFVAHILCCLYNVFPSKSRWPVEFKARKILGNSRWKERTLFYIQLSEKLNQNYNLEKGNNITIPLINKINKLSRKRLIEFEKKSGNIDKATFQIGMYLLR